MASLIKGLLLKTNGVTNLSNLSNGVTNLSSVAKRFVSYRKNCKFFDKARCDPHELQKTPCYKDIKAGKVLPDHPLRPFWDKPECCDDPCADAYVRFDDIHYFVSDKAKRKYTRTWNECPKIMLKCKKICCIKEKSPPFKKRPRNAVIDTACPGKDNCLALRGPCPKVVMAGCKAVRKTLKCRKDKRPPCNKFCAPYPSYSECQHPKPKPRPPIECYCLRLPMNCELIGQTLPKKRPRCQ